MNRRGFLRFLAAVPLLKHIPLPARMVYGSGNDGDIVLGGAKWVSPYKAISYGGGGGGGGGGGCLIIIKNVSTKIELTAKGGTGGNTHES
jgi:hypothetical protein